MKLLYDYHAFVMQARGGVSRVLLEIIRREAVRADVDCRVFAGVHRNFLLRDLADECPGTVKGLFLDPRLVKQRVFLPVDRALFTAYARKFAPDVCHHTFFETPELPSHTARVVTVHDLIGELFQASHHANQVAQRALALSKADGIVCVSENTKADLLKFYDLGEKPVMVAHHGNSFADIVPAPHHFRRPYFLNVGMRGGYKNFDCLLSAFSKLEQKDHYLICFGGGPFTSGELEQMRRLKIEDRVLHRAGSDQELAGYYQKATALIYPSKYEGFGLPLIEAFGLGCPVIASQAPPMPEISAEAALLFNPEDPGDLTTAMGKVITAPSLRESLVTKGRERAQAFDWEQTAQKVHEFYKTVCQLKKARRSSVPPA